MKRFGQQLIFCLLFICRWCVTFHMTVGRLPEVAPLRTALRRIVWRVQLSIVRGSRLVLLTLRAAGRAVPKLSKRVWGRLFRLSVWIVRGKLSRLK